MFKHLKGLVTSYNYVAQLTPCQNVVSVSAWKGSSGIGDEGKQRIIELVWRAKLAIVIFSGSPYILSHFKDAAMLIAAYGATTDAQKAVIKCLKEEMDFKGQLPVKLNLA